MKLFELQEKTKRILPVLVLTFAVGLGGLVVYSVFFYRPPAVPLTHSEVPAQSFAWSEDGGKIYYFASGDQGGDLLSPSRVLEVRKGSIVEDKVVEMELGTVGDITWSRDSRAIVSNLPSPGANSLLGIADFEKGNFTLVLLENASSIYALSPDGAKIAYATEPDEKGRSNLNLFSVGELQLIGENLLGKPLEVIEQLFWGADGEGLFIITRSGPAGAAPIMPELYHFDLKKRELKLLVAQDKGYFAFVPHVSGKVLLLSTKEVSFIDSESGKITSVFETSLHPYSTGCKWFNEDQFLCRVVDHHTSLGSEVFWVGNTKTQRGQRVSGISDKIGPFFAPSPYGDQLAYLDEEGFIRITPIE